MGDRVPATQLLIRIVPVAQRCPRTGEKSTPHHGRVRGAPRPKRHPIPEHRGIFTTSCTNPSRRRRAANAAWRATNWLERRTRTAILRAQRTSALRAHARAHAKPDTSCTKDVLRSVRTPTPTQSPILRAQRTACAPRARKARYFVHKGRPALCAHARAHAKPDTSCTKDSRRRSSALARETRYFVHEVLPSLLAHSLVARVQTRSDRNAILRAQRTFYAPYAFAREADTSGTKHSLRSRRSRTRSPILRVRSTPCAPAREARYFVHEALPALRTRALARRLMLRQQKGSPQHARSRGMLGSSWKDSPRHERARVRRFEHASRSSMGAECRDSPSNQPDGLSSIARSPISVRPRRSAAISCASTARARSAFRAPHSRGRRGDGREARIRGDSRRICRRRGRR